MRDPRTDPRPGDVVHTAKSARGLNRHVTKTNHLWVWFSVWSKTGCLFSRHQLLRNWIRECVGAVVLLQKEAKAVEPRKPTLHENLVRGWTNDILEAVKTCDNFSILRREVLCIVRQIARDNVR